MRICLICKQEIEAERAEAIPDTRLCAQHGREIERFGGEFRMTAEQERTSKRSSLKVNYGGITTARTRNQRAVEQVRDEYEMQQAND